jgi:hypothetical protein
MKLQLNRILLLWVFIGVLVTKCITQLISVPDGDFFSHRVDLIKKTSVLSVRLSRSFENERRLIIKKALVHVTKAKFNFLISNFCFNSNHGSLSVKPGYNGFNLSFTNEIPIFISVCNFRI